MSDVVFATAMDPGNPFRVAYYNGSGAAGLLNFETGQQEFSFQDMFSIADPYVSLVFSGDSRRIALTTLVSSPFFNVFDSKTGRLTFQQPVMYPRKDPITALPPQTAFTSDHRLILTETNIDGQIDLISSELNSVVTRFEMSPSKNLRVVRLGFSLDDSLVYAVTSAELKIWSAHSFQLQKAIQFKNIPSAFYLGQRDRRKIGVS